MLDFSHNSPQPPPGPLNTTDALPYRTDSCCKQNAGKPSKQDSFLAEDKLMRISADTDSHTSNLLGGITVQSVTAVEHSTRIDSFDSTTAFGVHYLTQCRWAQDRTSIGKL